MGLWWILCIPIVCCFQFNWIGKLTHIVQCKQPGANKQGHARNAVLFAQVFLGLKKLGHSAMSCLLVWIPFEGEEIEFSCTWGLWVGPFNCFWCEINPRKCTFCVTYRCRKQSELYNVSSTSRASGLYEQSHGKCVYAGIINFDNHEKYWRQRFDWNK